MNESARKVWREGVVPQLTRPGLEALKTALLADDERLLQGATTSPPPLLCVSDWTLEGACPIGFAGWQSEGFKTVGEVEEYFSRVCHDVDVALGEPAACRYALNWWDEGRREVVRAELLEEVNLALKEKPCPLN